MPWTLHIQSNNLHQLIKIQSKCKWITMKLVTSQSRICTYIQSKAKTSRNNTIQTHSSFFNSNTLLYNVRTKTQFSYGQMLEKYTQDNFTRVKIGTIAKQKLKKKENKRKMNQNLIQCHIQSAHLIHSTGSMCCTMYSAPVHWEHWDTVCWSNCCCFGCFRCCRLRVWASNFCA